MFLPTCLIFHTYISSVFSVICALVFCFFLVFFYNRVPAATPRDSLSSQGLSVHGHHVSATRRGSRLYIDGEDIELLD